MKAIKYFVFVFSVLILSSCLDQTTTWDDNASGYNLAGFESASASLAFVSDGSEYTFTLRTKLVGPTALDVKNPITMTIAVDQAAMDALAASDPKVTAAVEGVHYRLDQTEITLDPNNNFLNLFPVTVLTASNAGITNALAQTPVLILKVTNATGDAKVINNGKPIRLTLNYGCDSNLEGVYTLDIEINGGAATRHYTNEVITKTGIGEYRTTYVGHWTVAALGGTPGFTFYDVCKELTIPEQSLVDTYSNKVFGTKVGSADLSTNTLRMSYEVTFDDGNNSYDCVYVLN